MLTTAASAPEMWAAWATIVVLLLGVLGAAWRAGSTLRGIRDDLQDHERRIDDLEDGLRTVMWVRRR